MSLKLLNPVSRAFTGKFLPMLVLISTGMGNNASAQEEDPAPASPTETIEEIVVYGDKSLATLKQVVFRAEEDFFDLFSSLNDDDEFDIRCFVELPGGTHIKRHVCRANFVTEATSREYELVRTRGPRVPTVPAETVIMQKRRQLQEKMELMIAVNPELLEALNKYTNAKQEYQSERERKCAGKIFVCNNE